MQRTWTVLPTPTRWLIIVHNSSSRRSRTLSSPPTAPDIHTQTLHSQDKNKQIQSIRIFILHINLLIATLWEGRRPVWIRGNYWQTLLILWESFKLPLFLWNAWIAECTWTWTVTSTQVKRVKGDIMCKPSPVCPGIPFLVPPMTWLSHNGHKLAFPRVLSNTGTTCYHSHIIVSLLYSSILTQNGCGLGCHLLSHTEIVIHILNHHITKYLIFYNTMKFLWTYFNKIFQEQRMLSFSRHA